jgi:hypothetical protein
MAGIMIGSLFNHVIIWVNRATSVMRLRSINECMNLSVSYNLYWPVR